VWPSILPLRGCHSTRTTIYTLTVQDAAGYTNIASGRSEGSVIRSNTTRTERNLADGAAPARQLAQVPIKNALPEKCQGITVGARGDELERLRDVGEPLETTTIDPPKGSSNPSTLLQPSRLSTHSKSKCLRLAHTLIAVSSSQV